MKERVEATHAPNDSPPRLPRRYRRSLGALALVFAVTAVTAAANVGYRLGSPDYPSTGSVEAGFARDMQTHHAQAVEMALIIRTKTSDPTLRAVAYDITTTQQQQIGQMFAWLELWGLPPTSSTRPMAWMQASGHTAGMKGMGLLPDGRMPGMASAGDMTRLREATGPAAERQFLGLLITHHRAGITMAQTALDASDRPEVRRLASSIVKAQSAEVDQLQDLLGARQS